MRIFNVLNIVFSFSFKFINSDNLPLPHELYGYVSALNDGVNYLRENIYLPNDSSKASHEASRWAVVIVNINIKLVVDSEVSTLQQEMKDMLVEIVIQTDDLKRMYQMELWETMKVLPAQSIMTVIGLDEVWEDAAQNFKDLRYREIKLNNEFQERFPTLKDYNHKHNSMTFKEELLFNPCFKEVFNSVINETQCFLDLRCLALITEKKFHYGLSLISWLYFFNHLKYSEYCYAFTRIKDEDVAFELCSVAYNENNFLAKFDFPYIEYIFERATLCTLLGYVQFINRDWLKQVLLRATSRGCFRHTADATRKRNFMGYTKQHNYCDLKASYYAIAYLGMIVQNVSKEYQKDEVRYYSNKLKKAMDFIRKNDTYLDYSSALEILLTMEISFKMQEHESSNSTLSLEISNIYSKIKEHLTETENDQTIDAHCLLMMMNNPIEQTDHHNKCNLSATCIETLNSTQEQVSIKKLLYLTVAKHTRSCFIKSSIQDNITIDRICSKAYETIQIVKTINIIKLMQLVVFCGINGHSGFLKKSWNAILHSQQHVNGCFPDQEVSKTELDRLDRRSAVSCDPHTTLFALTMLSQTIRYIAETYFT